MIDTVKRISGGMTKERRLTKEQGVESASTIRSGKIRSGLTIHETRKENIARVRKHDIPIEGTRGREDDGRGCSFHHRYPDSSGI